MKTLILLIGIAMIGISGCRTLEESQDSYAGQPMYNNYPPGYYDPYMDPYYNSFYNPYDRMYYGSRIYDYRARRYIYSQPVYINPRQQRPARTYRRDQYQRPRQTEVQRPVQQPVQQPAAPRKLRDYMQPAIDQKNTRPANPFPSRSQREQQ